MRTDDHHRFRITHEPSGDEAEADTKEAALTAVRALLRDNDFEGTCRVWEGNEVIDVAWAVDKDEDSDSIFHTNMTNGVTR